MVEHIEQIAADGKVLAFIIRCGINPDKTTFVTPSDLKQQVGFIVYPAGGKIQRHMHRPLERHIVGTSEVIIVRRGCCEIDIYDDERNLAATRKLSPGDIMLMVGGGHGYRMLDDTVLLEIKQGPYTGVDEKENF